MIVWKMGWDAYPNDYPRVLKLFESSWTQTRTMLGCYQDVVGLVQNKFNIKTTLCKSDRLQTLMKNNLQPHWKVDKVARWYDRKYDVIMTKSNIL